MGNRPVVIDAHTFVADMRGPVFWVKWCRSVTVSEAMAAELAQRMERLVPALCPPMLVELNGMVSLTRGALHFFATESNVAAVAGVGPSAVDHTLSSFFKQVHQPPYPTRHFDDAVEAYAWLTNQALSPRMTDVRTSERG